MPRLIRLNGDLIGTRQQRVDRETEFVPDVRESGTVYRYQCAGCRRRWRTTLARMRFCPFCQEVGGPRLQNG